MSTQRVKYIKQFFPLTSYTYNNNVFSVVANNHLLFTGVPVYLTSDRNYGAVKGIANVTSSNTFTVTTEGTFFDQQLTHFAVDGYLPTQTGGQSEHTLPRGTGCDTVVQSYVNGTGGASFVVEVSLDKYHWIPSANITHSTTNNDTGFITISPGWAYMRTNINSIGANTNLVIMTGE